MDRGLGAAYEQLDDPTADRLEDELFRPVQAAYGQAQRTVASFASRHGLAERTFAAGSEPTGARSSAKDLIDRGVAVAEGADATLAGLQDSLMPIEVGDAELRDAIAGLRTTLAGLRGRAGAIERTLDWRGSTTGTTGFDAVDHVALVASRGPGGLVKHRENHRCGLSRVRPRRLATS